MSAAYEVKTIRRKDGTEVKIPVRVREEKRPPANGSQASSSPPASEKPGGEAPGWLVALGLVGAGLGVGWLLFRRRAPADPYQEPIP